MKELWLHEWNKYLKNSRLWVFLISLLLLTAISISFQLRQDKYITAPMSQKEYDDYRNTVISDAEKRLTISIFADSDDKFVLKNAHRIIEKYTECEDISVESSSTQGVRILCDSIYENIILLLWVLFCVNIVVFEEKKTGQYTLQRTTRYGRKHLGIIKQLVIVLMSVGGMLLTVSVRIMAIQLTVGMGNIHRSIQSVYPESIVHMSVFEVITFSIILKVVAVVAVACLIFWLSQFLKSGYTFVWITAIFFAASLAIYVFMPGNAWLSISKELNVWTFLNSTTNYTRYKNLSLLSNPIDYKLCFIYVMLGMIFIFGTTSGFVYGKKAVSPLQSRADIRLLKGSHTFAFLHEGYKLVFIAGWWILIFALPIGMYCLDERYYKYDNLSEYYELQYCNRLGGAWNSDYDNYLQDEIEKAGGIDRLENNILGLPQLDALAKIYKRADYLKNVKNGHMLYEKGYCKLFITQNSLLFVKQMLMMCILILISMGTIWFVEIKYDQIRLFRTTMHGLKRVRRHKKIYAVLLSTMIFVITWSLPFVRINNTYGSLNMSAPAASLEILSEFGNGISIGTVLWLQFLVLYIATVIFALAMIKIIGRILGGTDYE